MRSCGAGGHRVESLASLPRLEEVVLWLDERGHRQMLRDRDRLKVSEADLARIAERPLRRLRVVARLRRLAWPDSTSFKAESSLAMRPLVLGRLIAKPDAPGPLR